MLNKAMDLPNSVLVRREAPPVLLTDTDDFGNEVFKLKETGISELIYIPSCSFEESLVILDLFAFPTAIEDAPAVRKQVKRFLADFAHRVCLALRNVSPQTLLVKYIGTVENQLLERVFAFNVEHMGCDYSAGEREELIQLYKKQCYFVLGA